MDGKKPEMSAWQKVKAFLFDPEYFNEVRKEAGVTSGVERMQERLETKELELTPWGAEHATGVLPSVAESAQFAKDAAPFVAVAGAAAPVLGIAAGSALTVNAITAGGHALAGAAGAAKGALSEASLKVGTRALMAIENEVAIAKTTIEVALGAKGAGIALGLAESYLTAEGLAHGLPMEVVNPQSLLKHMEIPIVKRTYGPTSGQLSAESSWECYGVQTDPAPAFRYGSTPAHSQASSWLTPGDLPSGATSRWGTFKLRLSGAIKPEWNKMQYVTEGEIPSGARGRFGFAKGQGLLPGGGPQLKLDPEFNWVPLRTLEIK
jgi:hypothetical protein